MPSAVYLRRSPCWLPSHCRPSCTVSFRTVSVFGARFAFAGGRLPLHWSRRGPWGVAVAPLISPYTGPGWSPPFCLVPLVLRSVFSVYCATFRPYSWRSFGQFHLLLRVPCASPPYGVVPWTLAWGVIGWTYCPPPRFSGTLSFALTYGHGSRVLLPPAIDIVWRWPCLHRLQWL